MISNIEKVKVKAIIANEYFCYYHLGSILPFPSSNTMGSSHIKRNVSREILLYLSDFMCMYIYIYIYIYTHIDKYMCVCVCVCIYIYIYACHGKFTKGK